MKPVKLFVNKFSLITIIVILISSLAIHAKVTTVNFKKTLTVVELDDGDEVNYELNTRRIVRIKLISSNSRIIFSTLNLPGKGSDTDASVYKMECILNIDGQDLKMVRYVPAQESFYEPYNVNGLNIWFDAVKSLNQFYNENHGTCLPEKQVRLALHDAALQICPEEITSWCPTPDKFPDIGSSYRGEDTWLGTYFGADLHGGLDINMPSNSLLWAPFSVDNNYYFNTTAAGHNNNRWRAIKQWNSGDTWIIQTHHHNELLVPEFQPIEKGTPYAYSAGTLSGAHTHTHFIFKVKQPDTKEYYIDPWIIFWQSLENKKSISGQLNAKITPLKPSETGEQVHFDSSKSEYGINLKTPKFYWSFGDGGFSVSPNPTHQYQKPGIYPVTLTIYDGNKYSTTTQHITINGEVTSLPEFKTFQKNNISFNVRHPWKTNVYNDNKVIIPNTVVFSLPHRSTDTIPHQNVTIQILNKSSFSDNEYSQRIETIYVNGKDWLEFESSASKQSLLNIKLKPIINKLNVQEGESSAYLVIHDNEFVNSPTIIRIVARFIRPVNDTVVIVDNADKNCTQSSYFWLTNKLNPELGLIWSKCFGESFLISSDNKKGEEEYIRYTPNLKKGKYKVSLFSPLYEQPVIKKNIGSFYVNIKSRGGMETKLVNPAKSLDIGEFNFDSCNGYVEITNKGANGLIVADAVIFKKIE